MQLVLSRASVTSGAAGRLLTFVTLTALPISLGAACQAGELDDRQEAYLRRQLDKRYPNTAGEVSADTSSGAASTTDSIPGATSEPADTSIAPTPTSEPVPTSTVAAPSSEVASSTPTSTGDTNANPIPDCALQTFQTTCAGNACHYDGAINLPPNFETEDDLFTMLTTAPVACNSAPSPLYIDVANPENSYLLVKIRGQQPSGCGTAMPPDQTTITQAQIDCLEDWIGSL